MTETIKLFTMKILASAQLQKYEAIPSTSNQMALSHR
jgi:hypothetical protein